jgi:hypothetical protein
VSRSVDRGDAEPACDALACDPAYDTLRQNPRFVALLKPTGMRLCAPGITPRTGSPTPM